MMKTAHGTGSEQGPPHSLTAHAEFFADIASVPRARGFVAKVLLLWDCNDPERTVALLTTELVSNAVRHAATTIELDLTVGPDCVLIVETVDDDPGTPVLRPLPHDSESGRGIWLVDALARSWGVRALADGRKAVWFEIALSRR